MPDLEHTLQGHDLGFLKIVAGGWGIELNAPDTVMALPILIEGVVENADFAEVIEALPQDAKNVLQALMQNEGRMLWATFVRKYGELRRMGMARRDRERPDLKPASAVEVLWYRGLVGRAFLNLPPTNQPEEYAYIPEDLLPLLPSLRTDAPPPLGRPATPNESAHQQLARDRILDHACTLLAALRLKLDEQEIEQLPLGGIPARALKGLLKAANLLDVDLMPHPEFTRAFLEAPRGKALAQLVEGWMNSKAYNELRLLPGLRFEGDWENDALGARKTILELVSQVPENRWWSLAAFVAAIKEQHPDFQRPAGDYDSWFIRKENGAASAGAPGAGVISDGAASEGSAGSNAAGGIPTAGGAATTTYLRGFGAWDEVDGALVRFLISGPMHWLGLLDLAYPSPAEAAGAGSAAADPGGDSYRGADLPSALRLSRWAEALWHGDAPKGLPGETAPLKASADGRLTLTSLTPRAVRYQVARFCQFEGVKERTGVKEHASVKERDSVKEHGSVLEYLYRVTPTALERARAQGLRATQLTGLLRRHSEGPLPPTLLQALERWENSGTQALVEHASLLRVTSPEILAALRKTRAARGLGEALNETTVIIRPGMEDQILSALTEIGYLAEASILK